MGRFTFWILLAACLLAAGAVYVLEVSRSADELSSQLDVLDRMTERASHLAASAAGPKTVATMGERQQSANIKLERLRSRFAAVDADNIERWFDGLDTPWSEQPLREDFKRFYNLAYDQLVRDASRELEQHGYENVILALIDYPWMAGDTLPTNDEMRMVQREFWIQDRLVHAFSRVGALLTRRIRGGERQAAVGRSTGGHFDNVRYDVQVRCSPKNLRRVLHALDRPFEITYRGGEKETMFLNLVIDNVAVRRISVDTATANRYASEPPVEVSFFVTLLDIQGDSGSRE